MKPPLFSIEINQRFSESIIWQLNRDFYKKKGLSAFNTDIVPHNLTSNAYVGRTYAELILAFLKDLADQGKSADKLYIIELGAGHGRLAFHILTSLETMMADAVVVLPPICYVLSDIVEENLTFFQQHPQLQRFIKAGLLDVSYFDAVESTNLYLRNSKLTINIQDLDQPIIGLANYFFDSIPSDLYYIKDHQTYNSEITIQSKISPDEVDAEVLIKNLEFTYENKLSDDLRYTNPLKNEILKDYQHTGSENYLFYPSVAMQCIENLQNLSKRGLFLISLDKGFHELTDIESFKVPDLVKHGSFSIWVNYHALGEFCTRQEGLSLFPSSSTFHLKVAALLFLSNSQTYRNTQVAYERFINDFGPDDYNSIKNMAYSYISKLTAQELLALFRLSEYDSSFFKSTLPRLKQVAKEITEEERKRISEALQKVWSKYFSIGESFDLAYEIAGIFYDLGLYNHALNYFKHSINLLGAKADSYYNLALCYYQLRQDTLFFETISFAKDTFPDSDLFEKLEGFDVS